MFKRMTNSIFGMLLTLPALAGIPTEIATGMQVQTFEAGIFQAVDVSLGDDERLLNTGSEKIIETREIPAKLGTKFGIRFTLIGKNHAGGNQVKYFYLTPGVMEPTGIRHDKYEVVQSLSATAPHHVIAFEFTEPYEVIPGEWQLMVFQGDRLLLKESFAVGIDEESLSAPAAIKPKTLNSAIQAVP